MCLGSCNHGEETPILIAKWNHRIRHSSFARSPRKKKKKGKGKKKKEKKEKENKKEERRKGKRKGKRKRDPILFPKHLK
jgi:hypothetical protein